MADWLTPEQRSRNMASIRSRGSRPEQRLGEIAQAVFGDTAVVPGGKDLPGRPDWIVPGVRLALFADGCFFHKCPLHGHVPEDNQAYWLPKLEGNAERDRHAGRALRELGWNVVRVWEHDLRKRPDKVLRRLRGWRRRLVTCLPASGQR